MALKILDTCINCGVCEPECPNDAITEGVLVYDIEAKQCTECVGHFDTPQCIEVCPIECIIVDPEYIEDKDSLLAKLRRMEEA
ncbi:MAG TPA: YfhL family 4Fe-4S dicluster ferredoxin [Crenotrichaceae bacterium]|nr:YfhL family 4Fe-4S dicluster ferredoxin [Crenotrichaceae bacterium]